MTFDLHHTDVASILVLSVCIGYSKQNLKVHTLWKLMTFFFLVVVVPIHTRT